MACARDSSYRSPMVSRIHGYPPPFFIEIEGRTDWLTPTASFGRLGMRVAPASGTEAE